MTGLPQPTFDGHSPGDSGAGFGRRMIAWLQQQESRRTALSVTVLLGLCLLFYYRLWWPGLILVRRDAIGLFAPVKQYMAERLLQGEVPQWFPYEGLGRSFISTAVTGVFHVFSLFYLILPAHDAFRLSVLLSCLAGAIGAFALGRTLGCSRAGSVLAGLVFSCSGFVVSLTENVVYLYGLCVLPLFCAALDRALAGSVPWGVAAAAAWASVFLNGDIQTGYYYGFVALSWSLMRAEGARWRASFIVAGLAGVAALLAGVQLAPSAVAFLASDRLDSVAFHDTALAWSTHPLRLLTMLASPFDLEKLEVAISDAFLGGSNPKGFLALSLYVGMPAAGLALIGGWYRKDLRGLVLLGCVALWLALGRYGGLYEAFYHSVPFWSAFRYPEKLMGVVSLVVALLAGAGLDECRRGRASAVLWVILTLVCLGFWGIFQMEATGAGMTGYFKASASLVRSTTESLSGAFLLSAVASLGLGVIMASMRRGWLSERVLLGLLVLVVALDLSRVNQAAYHTGPADVAQGTPLFVHVLVNEPGVQGAGHVRVFPRVQSVFFYPEQSLSFAGILAVIMRQALYSDLSAEFHLESISPYLPGQSSRMREMQDLIWDDAMGARALARYNVGYIIGDSRLFEKPPFSNMVLAALPSYRLALVKNPVVPHARAYLSRQPIRAGVPEGLKSLMYRRGFLSGEIDVIEAFQDPVPGPAYGGNVRIERYLPEEVRIGVETSTPAVLVLLDAYEAGWRASLEDGRELPIWRANALVRAVAVPAGAHQVTFTYRTPLLAAGAWCSSAGVLLCAGLLWSAWRSRKRGNSFQEQHESPSC